MNITGKEKENLNKEFQKTNGQNVPISIFLWGLNRKDCRDRVFYLLLLKDQAREVRQVVVEASESQVYREPTATCGSFDCWSSILSLKHFECLFPSILLSDLNANTLYLHHDNVRLLRYFWSTFRQWAKTYSGIPAGWWALGAVPWSLPHMAHFTFWWVIWDPHHHLQDPIPREHVLGPEREDAHQHRQVPGGLRTQGCCWLQLFGRKNDIILGADALGTEQGSLPAWCKSSFRGPHVSRGLDGDLETVDLTLTSPRAAWVASITFPVSHRTDSRLGKLLPFWSFCFWSTSEYDFPNWTVL